MIFKFRCPKCDIRLTVADHKAGQLSRCPSCQQSIRIPPAGPADPIGQPDRRTAPPSPASVAPRPLTTHPSTPAGDGPLLVETESGSAEPGGSADRSDTRFTDAANDSSFVHLPRWVIYAQAGLLVIVASTFFVFGMMTRQLAGAGGTPATAHYACQLTGTVHLRRGEASVPDEGAVVIVLPADQPPPTRPDAQALRPESFEPLDNPAIEAIEALGGRVVRINSAGSFDLSLTGPREYHVLIISRGATRPPADPIPKSQAVAIGRYFFPVEALLGRQQFYWGSVKLNRQSQAIPPLTF